MRVVFIKHHKASEVFKHLYLLQLFPGRVELYVKGRRGVGNYLPMQYGRMYGPACLCLLVTRGRGIHLHPAAIALPGTLNRSYGFQKWKCRHSPCFVPDVPAKPGAGHAKFAIAMNKVAGYVTGRQSSSTRSQLSTRDQKILCWVLRCNCSKAPVRSLPHTLHSTRWCRHCPEFAFPSMRLLYVSHVWHILILPRMHTIIFIFETLVSRPTCSKHPATPRCLDTHPLPP